MECAALSSLHPSVDAPAPHGIVARRLFPTLRTYLPKWSAGAFMRSPESRHTMSISSRLSAATVTRPAMLLIGGAIFVGTLDLLYACGYWWLLHGVLPARIIQVIASGVLGRRSFDDGGASVLLGLVLQYAISFVMVWAYYLVSGWMPALIRRGIWIYGVLYGLWLYVAMNDIVVPLSAAMKGSTVPSWVVGSVLESALLIGPLVAWIARRARVDSWECEMRQPA